MNNLNLSDENIIPIFKEIKHLVNTSKNKIYNTINIEMLNLYWNIGKITHQDIGQMQMYVNYYDRDIKNKDENQTVGILLSTEKNETVVKYTLPEGRKNIFSSLYKLHLPTKEELIEAVEEEKKNFKLNN